MGGGGLRPLKSPWFGAGCYLAEQLVHLHGLYLKAAGGLKIEEFRLSRDASDSRFPGQRLALARVHLCCSWAGGQGHSSGFLPHPPWPGPAGRPSAHQQSSLAWAGMGPRSCTWGRAAVQVPTGALTSGLAL